jgi:hypothetical protein
MREGDELTPYKKKFLRELNQFSEDTNSPKRWTPEEIDEKFTEAGAKRFIQEGRFGELYEDYVTKPDNIGKAYSIRLGKDVDRKRKSMRPKTKRNSSKKVKGCRCK